MVSLVSKLAFSLVLFNLLCDVSTPKIASLNFGARLSINHSRLNMSLKRSSLTASIFWNNLRWFGLPKIFYHWFIFSFLNFATNSLKLAIKTTKDLTNSITERPLNEEVQAYKWRKQTRGNILQAHTKNWSLVNIKIVTSGE